MENVPKNFGLSIIQEQDEVEDTMLQTMVMDRT